MRKALIVGIDHYDRLKPLRGCVADATAVSTVLKTNFDNTTNFKTAKLLTATDRGNPLYRKQLRTEIQAVFAGDPDVALFYFAGHGFVDETGGFLCASDSEDGSDGLPIAEIMTFATQSKARNRIIILDSCYGGIAGNRTGGGSVAEIAEGVTLLTASTEKEYAYEGGNGAPGVFTNLLVDALNGEAANLVGEVTPGSVYAHIDQSLGPWGGQRPVFKTNVKSFVSLRKAKPPISLDDLKKLATLFPSPKYQFKLDPSFEPERELPEVDVGPDPANNEIFSVLQNYVKVGLVRPVGAPHMWHAAMYRHSCELTVLGEHYRRLVAEDLI